MADNNDGATVQPVMGAAFDEVDNEADGGAAAAMSDDDDESVVMNELDAYDAPDWQDQVAAIIDDELAGLCRAGGSLEGGHA